MKGFKQMRAKEFAQIKSLLGAGISRGTIATTLKRSYPTVSLIDKVPDFSSYKEVSFKAYKNRMEKTLSNSVKWVKTPELSLEKEQQILVELQEIVKRLDMIVKMLPSQRANPTNLFHRFFMNSRTG